MAKKAKVENPFVGIWRIVSMPDFDEKYLHEEVQAFIEFDERNSGEFQFSDVHGFMDCRLTTRDGEPTIEWTWDGNDEMDPAQGRGQAAHKGTELHGTIYFHQGGDFDFVARKKGAKENEAMTEQTSIQPGRYRHYKGNEYTAIGTARHSETLEELVVYRQEYGDHGLWVRPKQMFLETVVVDDHELPRFQQLESSSEQGEDKIENIFDDLPQQLPKEVVQTLISAADVRIERIISHGHRSAADFWYNQPQHEWVIVLKGAARLQFEDGIVEMKPGDFINIPAHKKHRVDWTTPDESTVWLGVRYGDQG